MDRRHYASAFALLIMLGCMLLATGDSASAYDYVSNGGFEGGTDGWGPTQAELGAVDASEVPPAEGSYSARVSLLSSHGFVASDLMTLGPGTYTFSARVRRTTAGDTVSVQVGSDSIAGVDAAPGVDMWISVSGDVTVASLTTVNFRVQFGGTIGHVFYLDDVHVDGAAPVTPPPSSTPTMIASSTPLATTTGTRTTTPTHTATASPTPTASPIPIGAALRNAGFEDAGSDGAPEAWDHFGGEVSMVASPVHGGGHAASLESSTAATKWLYQSVAVEPGATYEFGAWVLDNDDGVGSAFLRLSWYESEDGSGSALASADSLTRIDAPQVAYQYLTTGGIAAPGSAHSAKLRIMLAPVSAAHAEIFVDDTAFGPATAAPPPTAEATALSADAPFAGGATEPPRTDAVLGTHARPRGSAPTAAATDQRSQMHVVINEVLYDPDAGPSDTAGEWVELYNAGASPVDLGDWTLSDSVSGDTLPWLTVAPGEFVAIAASASLRDAYPEFNGRAVVLGGRIGNALGNDGDRVALRDAGGNLADAISWGTDASVLNPAIADVPAGHSIERRTVGGDTDSAVDWIDNDRPSPGAPHAATPGSLPRPNGATSARIVATGGGSWVGRWAPWLIAAVASTGLAGVASARLVPLAAQRLRRHA